MSRRSPAFPQPATLVDVAIFAVREAALHVLLVRRAEGPDEPFPGRWALPGGYVDVERDTDLSACARRKLAEKTGVASPYLEQLGSWGSATRDPRGWSATHVFFALVSLGSMPLEKGANASDVGWFDVAEVLATVPLAFDHGEILRSAVERLRGKKPMLTTGTPIWGNVHVVVLHNPSMPAAPVRSAPTRETYSELQQAYEVVLGRPVDKSGFRTRMLSAGFLVETGQVPRGTNRPPMGYRLKDRTGPVVFPRTFSPRSA